MPIISFSKKALDEYVTFSSDSIEPLDQQVRPLKLSRPKEEIFTPLNLMDAEGFTEAKNKVMEMIDSKPDVLVIDMKNIPNLNGMGLGLIITLLNLMKEINGRLILCSLSEQVKLHLKLTGVDNLLEIYDQYPNIK